MCQLAPEPPPMARPRISTAIVRNLRLVDRDPAADANMEEAPTAEPIRAAATDSQREGLWR